MATMIKIADAFDVTVTPAVRDSTATVADVAQYIEFNTQDILLYDTTSWCIAFDALEDEYGAFEKAAGGADYYDGAWMTFKDGSTIRFGGM